MEAQVHGYVTQEIFDALGLASYKEKRSKSRIISEALAVQLAPYLAQLAEQEKAV